MSITTEEARVFAERFEQLVANVEQAVVGKTHVVRLALTCLLSEGHLLLEDVPGTGKTCLAKAISNTVDGENSRIQFTPDMLPSDVTGVHIFDERTKDFSFHKGPIFANVVLADEINRASPKTQSALLQPMEEGWASVDGTPFELPRPFMVIATQNPIEQAGTYRLPEAQLDRFLMKTKLDYPDQDTTISLLAQAANRDRATSVSPLIAGKTVTAMARKADEVHVDVAILRYVSQLAEESRANPSVVRLGISVRGCLALVRVAKTWAAAHGRHFVLPDDIKELAQPVLCHRLLIEDEAEFGGTTVQDVIADLIGSIRAPEVRAA